MVYLDWKKRIADAFRRKEDLKELQELNKKR